MVEKFAFKALGTRTPIAMCSFKHRKGSHDIGSCKGEGILDRTIHVAFGRQMDNAIHLILLHQRKNGIKITDIRLDEGIVRSLLNILQIGQIPGIGQLVEVDNMIVGLFRNEKPYDMRTDKSGSTGNDDIAFEISFHCLFFKTE